MKIVLQKDLKDCGVCSLQSIIKHYNGYVSLEKLRIDAKVTNEGTTALNLILASKKYGFDAVGVKLDSIDEVKTLPAIIHLNLKNGLTHFVVVYKITKDKVILMDPAKGKLTMKKVELNKIWSKVVLLFYPNKNIAIFKKYNTIFDIFKKIIFSEKKLVILIFSFSIVLTLLTIIGSYYFQVMGNAINDGYEKSYLMILIASFGFLTFIKLIISYIRIYLENHLNKNIDSILNYNFLKHLYHLPLNVITSRTTGEVVTRVSELANVKSLITDLFITSSLDFLLMLVAMPLLINISGKLFLVLFSSLILYFLVGIITSKVIYKKAYQNISYEEEFNNALIEDINMINSIKNLNEINYFFKRIESKLTCFLYDGYLLNIFLNRVSSIKESISEIGFFIINTIGFYLVLNKNITFFNLVTFNTLLAYFYNPIKNIIDGLPKYNYLKATIEKLNDFLGVGVLDEGKVVKLNNNDIEIRNLNYSYNNLNNILDNINLKIEAGKFVSFEGSSGSGKSTICKIIDKYIEDYQGEVLIGGINIKDLSISTIRKNILYVNQQEAIFTGTIKENIILGATISEEYFKKICSICKIEEILKNKPLRYETTITNEGTNISGGEKNRIILARALVRDFNILILDEALSEVDYKLERKIIKNIKREFKDKTIIYITHKKHKNLFDKVFYIGDLNEHLRFT